MGAAGGRPIPLRGSEAVTPGKFFDAKSRVWGQFGPENKLINGQPNEYDVIRQNASVLAFHLWSTIFTGAPFRFQNVFAGMAFPHHCTPAAKNQDQIWNPTLGNRVWATLPFTFHSRIL